MENEDKISPDDLLDAYARFADTYEAGVAILRNSAKELDVVEWSNWVNTLLHEQVIYLGKLTTYQIQDLPEVGD